MRCKYCRAIMSAGDISMSPSGDGFEMVLICPECDEVQPREVKEEGGLVFILPEGVSADESNSI